VEVNPVPGLAHLPWAEVWLHAVDEDVWREASRRARRIGKTGLEVWTTDATPEVVSFLLPRGYEEVRRYVLSELDVEAAPEPDAPGFPLVTLAERPDLARAIYEIALESYCDQPGRAETRIGSFEDWRVWGLDPHEPDAYFIALDLQGAPDERVLGYGFLELGGEVAKNGFTAVARSARGRGVAGAIKRAQIAWAKAHGLRRLQTANEARLTGMLALNERHGYRPYATELILRGPLAPID
jgi:GNAT superfamily N-acetyltransferase